MNMKKFGSLLVVASVLALATSQPASAADLFWSGNGTTQGGNGTWDTTLTRWGTVVGGPYSTVWSNGSFDNAVFGSTAGTATLGANITVGGLQFNTTGYTIANGANILSFGAANNAIVFNGIAAARITGTVSGSGNLALSTTNPSTAGTLTFNGTSTGGWSGSTTINPGMTLNTTTVSGQVNQVLNNTSGITINSGAIQFNRATNAQLNAISDNATITVNGGGTFGVTSADAGGVNANETIGAVTVNSGQMNFNWTNGASSGAQMILSGLSTSGTAAVTFSGDLSSTGRWRVVGAGNTTAGQIIGPWATTGAANGIAAQTDYAVYGSDFVAAANIAASAQSAWVSTTDAYAMSAVASGTLTANRSITAIRSTNNSVTVTASNPNIALAANTLALGDVVTFSAATMPTGLTAGTPYYVVLAPGNGTFQVSATPGGGAITPSSAGTTVVAAGGILVSSGNNLGTTGILNGSATTLNILQSGGAGAVTLPSATSGNVHVTTGSGAITIAAPITDNGAGVLTLVKNGTGGVLTLSSNNTFTGGLVVNAGTLRLSGAQSFTGNVTLNGGSFGDATTALTAAALNSNNITVNGVATMAVTGAGDNITGGVLINSSGVLRLGEDAGTAQVAGVLSGSGILDVFSPGGSGSSMTLTNTTNTFTGGVVFSAPNNGGFTLAVNSFADSASPGAGNIVMGYGGVTSTQTFALHTGTIAPVIFTNRQFELQANASGQTLKIANNSSHAFTINSNLNANAATGTRTLRLGGTGAGLSTFNGTITNGGLTTLNLTKEDASNTWILSQNNTYNGTTTITAGTLQIGNGGTTGSLSPSSAISNSGTLTFNRSNDLVQGTDFATGISGTGAVIKNGAGNVTFSAANTYSGTTTVSAGKILMTNALALQNSPYNTTGSNGSTIGIDVTSGLSSGTLTLGGLSGSVNLASAFTAGYTGNVTNLTLNPQTGVTVTYSGVIANGSGNMTLTKTGAGSQELNGNSTFSGGVNISAGSVIISNASNANALGVSSNIVTFTGNATLHNNNGLFTMAQGITVNPTFTGTLSGAFGEVTTVNGPVTGSGNLNISSGSNGFAVNLDNTANTLNGTIWVASTAGQNTSLSMNSLADGASSGKNLKLGSGAEAADFTLGASLSSPVVLSTRQIELSGTTGAVSFRNNAASANNTVTINTNLAVTTNGAKTLTLGGSNTGANTFVGTIGNSGSGATAITKADGGTWILSGTNTYTGITTISGGTLSVATIGNGGVAGNLGNATSAAANLVLGGGRLQYTGTTASSNRSFTLTAATTSTIDITTNNLTISGASTATTGGLTKAGAGTLTLTGTNLYTGVTTINAGTLSVATIGNGGVAGNLGNATSAAANLVLGGTGTLQYTGATASTNRAFTLTAGQTGTFDITTNDLTISGVSAATTGALTKIGNGTLILSGNNTYTGATTVNGGTLRAGAAVTQAFGNNSTVTLANTAGVVLDLNNFDQNIGLLAGGGLTGGNVTLGSGNLTIRAAGTASYAGVISGTGTVTRSGSSGNQTLSGNNTYTGLTTVLGGGTLTLSGDNIAASGGVTLNGATANTRLNIGSATALGNGTFTISGGNNGGFDNTSGGALTLTTNNAQTWSNDFVFVGSNSLNMGTGAVTMGGTRGVNVTANTLTVGGAIAGSGFGITKSGAGTLSLTGNSGYSGVTTVSAGTLEVAILNNGGTNSSMGNSTSAAANLVFGDGARLRYTGTGGSTDRSFTMASVVNSNMVLDASGSGAINFTNTGSPAYGTAGQTRRLTLSGTNTGNNTLAAAVTNNGAGVLTLTKLSPGRWVLSGNNTYTGNTTISAGTLHFATARSLYNNTPGSWTAANIVVQSGGTLGLSLGGTGEFSNGNVTTLLTSLAASSSATNGMNAGSGFAFDTTNASGGNFTIGDIIANSTGASGGARSVTKLGTNTLIFTGNNSYTGSTNVNAGTLRVNGSLAAGSVVTVLAGATLGGNGTVGGPTTIFGIHDPGNSPGVQTFGSDLTYSGGNSTINWEQIGNTTTNTGNATFDQIIVGGNLDFAGATGLNLTFNGAGSGVLWANAFWSSNQSWTLHTVTGTTTNFSNLLLNGNSTVWLDSGSNTLLSARPSASFSVSQSGQNVLINYIAVPEPTTLAIVACGTIAGVVALRRRRRKSA